MKNLLNLNRGVTDLYPTPVMYGTIEESELREKVFHEILLKFNLENNPSEFQSFDILNDGGDILREFRDTVVFKYFNNYLKTVMGQDIHTYKNYSFKSWLAGSTIKYMMPTHNHSGALLSGVFYIFSEEKNSGGELVLFDPRNNANRGYDENFDIWFSPRKILPSTSEYIIFPSYLYHQTLLYTGKLRIAIPVDFYK